MMPTQEQILDFWFGPSSGQGAGQVRAFWFKTDPEFDQILRDRFLAVYRLAAQGELADWQGSALGCLALILLLDQFPRNLFRGSPQSFATDPQALLVAESVIHQGWDGKLLPVQRWFIYLPFEHSEHLQHQQRSLALFQQLHDHPQSAGAIAFAQRHYQVIERFGRFPHRNSILGRTSTPEELEFLSHPGSGF
jgi:uncharacterized protein (DUF924 family)